MLYWVYGALAQLGARNIRIVKATGSTPVCSILIIKIHTISFYFFIYIDNSPFQAASYMLPMKYNARPFVPNALYETDSQ